MRLYLYYRVFSNCAKCAVKLVSTASTKDHLLFPSHWNTCSEAFFFFFHLARVLLGNILGRAGAGKSKVWALAYWRLQIPSTCKLGDVGKPLAMHEKNVQSRRISSIWPRVGPRKREPLVYSQMLFFTFVLCKRRPMMIAVRKHSQYCTAINLSR